MDPISKIKVGNSSYDIKDQTARLAIVTLNDNKLDSDGVANKTASIPYGEVDSTSTATAFTATVDGITELRDGVCMLLKNGVVTSASGFTININNLGAKPCYNNMTTGNDITPINPTRDTTIFNINYTMLFVYSSTIVDGGGWICYRGYDANTNTIGYQLRTNSYTLNAADTFRYYQILFTSADGTKWVPANSNQSNSATTKKTVNQTPINPFGEIVYCGSSTNYSAGAAVSATTTWQQYTVTLGYSFNTTGAALALTTKKPVYIKCAPQSNGSAIIDSTTPYVQNLPSTEDGKIYILLGMAYSATAIELLMNHPVYYYKDGAIRLWSNAAEDESELAISAALNDLNSRVSLTEITWAELKELRDNSNLVPGKQYRITDYVATVDSYAEPNARSANHQFDVIVTADSVNKLNEQARAIQHSGDTYFANSNLAAWELKYKLDNVQWSVQSGEWIFTDDGLWFILTGTTEIDGHTYKLWYSKDFDPGDATYGYLATTSNNINDGASTINIDTNTIASVDYSTIEQYKSSDVDGKGTILYMKDEFNNECPYDFKNIQFKRWKATDAISGRRGLNNLYVVANADGPAINLSVSNTEDYIWAYTFSSGNDGGDQTDFSLGDYGVHDNVFYPYSGKLLNNVMFGRDNYCNSFGMDCHNNSCSGYCLYNSWRNNCSYNSLATSYQYNSCGNDYQGNSCGDWCKHNSCGNYCTNNSWSNRVTDSTVFDDVQYTQIITENVKFVQVLNGVQGTPSSKLTLAFAANKTYTQIACLTSAGALKIYVPGDL